MECYVLHDVCHYASNVLFNHFFTKEFLHNTQNTKCFHRENGQNQKEARHPLLLGKDIENKR